MKQYNEKIFCVGFSKTGTTSLETSLEKLGYNVCKGHWNNNHTYYLMSLYINNDIDEILKMSRYWNAFADAPWGGTELYKTLIKEYPNSKFILSIRDENKWYKSFKNMIKSGAGRHNELIESYHIYGRWGASYFFRKIFQMNKHGFNESKIKEIYNSHNKEVKSFFEDKKEQLLIINLEEGDNWQKICNFLNRPIPKEPFPYENKTNTEQKYSFYQKLKANLSSKLFRKMNT